MNVNLKSLDLVPALSKFFQSLSITKNNQKSASTFADNTTTLYGFGFLPLCARFDPTDSQIISSCLIPTQDDIIRADPCHLGIWCEDNNLMPCSEGSANGVQHQFDKSVLPHFDGMISNGRTTLKSKCLSTGVATELSYADNIWVLDKNIFGVVELKGTEASTSVAMREGAVYATNIAIGLLNHGLPFEKCIVPVVGCTGALIQFAATIILDKSFPTFVPISKIFDLADVDERKMSSAYLHKYTEHVSSTYKLLESLKPSLMLPCNPVTELVLNRDAYPIKCITKNGFNRGFVLFAFCFRHR